MARQPVSPFAITDFDPDTWFTKWFEERARARSWLAVEIPTLLQEGAVVSVVALSETCPVDPTVSTGDWGLCLVSEILTLDTASSLAQVLSMLKTGRQLDPKQGLAYIVQSYLQWVDYRRAWVGDSSVLADALWVQLGGPPVRQEQLADLQRRPLWPLGTILEYYWSTGPEGHATDLVAHDPDLPLGQTLYLTIPPMWLPLEKFREIYSEDAGQTNGPGAGEVSLKIMADRLERFERDFDIERREQRAFRKQFEPTMRASLSENSHSITKDRVEDNVFRQQGDFWTITYQGKRLAPIRSKNLRYIAFLLGHTDMVFSNPSELVFAVEKKDANFIVKSDRTPTEERLADSHLSESFGSDTGQVIDARTRQAVELRREQCQERLEAQDFTDPEEAVEIRQEIDQLEEYLASTVGLGGKIRQSGDPREKARQLVSQAIHRSLRQIERHHRELAAHLRHTLTPVKFPLRYAPDQSIDWIT